MQRFVIMRQKKNDRAQRTKKVTAMNGKKADTTENTFTLMKLYSSFFPFGSLVIPLFVRYFVCRTSSLARLFSSFFWSKSTLHISRRFM